MLRSIQEFLRKINSVLNEKLTLLDFMGIIGVILGISALFIILLVKDLSARKEITYVESSINQAQMSGSGANPALIVASKNGTTYYYSWCTGVSRIKSENKIIFKSEVEAQESGRRLASGCLR